MREIRLADSHDQLERLIKRIRRGGVGRGDKPSATSPPAEQNNERNANQFLRRAAEDAEDEATTGLELDAQLLSIIRGTRTGEVARGRWWPNGMTSQEFRDIRRLLFAGNGKFWKVKLRGRRHASETSSAQRKCQQQDSERVRVTAGGDNDNRDGHGSGQLNRGFHWRVNFLLGLAPPPPPIASGDRGSWPGNNSGNCVVKWTMNGDKMCSLGCGRGERLRVASTCGDIESQFEQLQVADYECRRHK